MNTQRGLAFFTDRKELLESTLFVGGAKAQNAFGVALYLEHLNQRLEFLT